MAQAGIISDAIEHLVLLIKKFQIFLPFFSDLLYYFTVSTLLPTDPPMLYLMICLVLMPVQSLEPYNIYLYSGIPAFLKIMQ